MLIPLTCPRCGKETVGLRRPIYASRAVYDQFKGQCSDCTSDEERELMMQNSAAGIQRLWNRRPSQ